MKIKIRKSTLYSGTAGLVVALLVVLITHKPASVLNTPVVLNNDVSNNELLELQTKLAASRNALAELKAKLGTDEIQATVDKITHDRATVKPLTESEFEFTAINEQTENNVAQAVAEDIIDEIVVSETVVDTVVNNRQAAIDSDVNNSLSNNDWRLTSEEEIISAFNEINPSDSQLLNAKCESEQCQIEISHADPAAEIQFLASISASELIFGHEGYFQKFENEDGSSRSVFYFSKQNLKQN